MAITSLPAPIPMTTLSAGVFATRALDATGESHSAIGRVHIQGGGTKTISAAGGGAITWATTTAPTFANGATNLRIGIQDVVMTTGLEDTTYDVYADLVGGTDTINAVWNTTPMESGTKTIADGDLVAVVIELTNRAGADTVSVSLTNTFALGPSGFPYGTVDGGAGPTKTTNALQLVIKFDDGTYGWIEGLAPITGDTLTSTGSYNSSSTPDEYAAIFTVAVDMEVAAFGIGLASVVSGDDCEFHFYSDPLGSPSVIETITMDADLVGAGSSTTAHVVKLAAPYTVLAGVAYGLSVRPTGAGGVVFRYHDLGSAFSFLKNTQAFSTIKMGSRSNQTGAFSEVQTYYLPMFALSISGLHDGTGAGTAPTSYVF